MAERTRFILIGGFLGAGKTTAMARLAAYVVGQDKRVGLITNDQAGDPVDTLDLRVQGFRVEEVTGGCFCCRLDSLMQAAQRLADGDRPDVLLAEPVGTCTDLMATVAVPAAHIHGDHLELGPYTVLLDPHRAWKVLTHQKRGGFSPKVAYIYRNQIEEADAIAVNKVDTVSAEELQRLVDVLRSRFPGRPLFTFSARSGHGLATWLEYALSAAPARDTSIDVDYDTYAEGEAELAWLNTTGAVESDKAFDANDLLLNIADGVRKRVVEANGEIAHLKMILVSGQDIGLLSLAREDAAPELSQSVRAALTRAELTLNARAAASPDLLRRAWEDAATEVCRSAGLRHVVQRTTVFRPARPQPTHRMTIET